MTTTDNNLTIIHEFLYFLTNLGNHRFIKIGDRFYAFTKFKEATPQILKHFLEGRDITNFLKSNTILLFNVQGQERQIQLALDNFLDSCIPIKKEFHHSIPFEIWMVN